jgi:hypothetical protein
VNTNEEPSEELQHILGCLVMEILSFNLLLCCICFFFFTMYLIWITVTI